MKMVVDENAFTNQCVETLEVVNISESNVADSGLSKAKNSGVLSTPAVRNFAKQLGVNIEDVYGTGKEGRVLKDDVLNYAACKGILKESLASSNASYAEQHLEGDQKSQDISSINGPEYEDRIIPLRYSIIYEFFCK